MWLRLLDYIKVLGIKCADAINAKYEPWKEFTRPLNAPTPTTALSDKANLFEHQLKERFVVYETPSAVIWDYKKQLTGDYDLGDQALWHGVTTYMLGLKYRQTGAGEDYTWFTKSVMGMYSHQPGGRLIRGVSPSGAREDEASSDSATGHLLGIYAAFKFGAAQHGEVLARGFASSLLNNNDCLTNVKGKVTKHGRLTWGPLTDPLNLLVALTAYKLAAVSGLKQAQDRYDYLVKVHKPLLKYGHVSLLQWRKDYDEHRAAICHMILAVLEKDPDLTRLYALGLVRDWKRCRKARNPWMYYLVHRIVSAAPNDAAGCLQRLAEMDVSRKIVVVPRINSVTPYPGVNYVHFGGRVRAEQPLPLWMVASQDFFWQRNQYSVDDRLDQQPDQIEHNGVDFLICYYGFKELGIL